MEASTKTVDSSPLPFLHLMEVVKHLPRTGWLRTIPDPESVGSHSFRLALICLFAPAELDRSKCISIALCHDVAESVVGDIPTFAGVLKEEKHRRERSGFEYIRSLIKPCDSRLADEIVDLWLEYEGGSSPEARWVKEMDKLECIMQANEYEQRTHGTKDLDEFQGLSSKITSPQGRAWLELLQAERQAHISRRSRRLPVIFAVGSSCSTSRINQAFAADQDWFQCLSLKQILQERSCDEGFLHSKFLRNCLTQCLPVPTSLVVASVLEVVERMEQQGKWTLVCEFPLSAEHRLEFERQVQIPNYVILLSKPQEEGVLDPGGEWRHSSGQGRVKEILGDNSPEMYNLIKDAVYEFKALELSLRAT